MKKDSLKSGHTQSCGVVFHIGVILAQNRREEDKKQAIFKV